MRRDVIIAQVVITLNATKCKECGALFVEAAFEKCSEHEPKTITYEYKHR